MVTVIDGIRPQQAEQELNNAESLAFGWGPSSGGSVRSKPRGLRGLFRKHLFGDESYEAVEEFADGELPGPPDGQPPLLDELAGIFRLAIRAVSRRLRPPPNKHLMLYNELSAALQHWSDGWWAVDHHSLIRRARLAARGPADPCMYNLAATLESRFGTNWPASSRAIHLFSLTVHADHQLAAALHRCVEQVTDEMEHEGYSRCDNPGCGEQQERERLEQVICVKGCELTEAQRRALARIRRVIALRYPDVVCEVAQDESGVTITFNVCSTQAASVDAAIGNLAHF